MRAREAEARPGVRAGREQRSAAPVEEDPRLALRELGFLQSLARAAASTQEPRELMELIIRGATSATETDVCSIYLLQPGGDVLLLAATNGLNERMVGRVEMKLGEGVTGHVAATRKPLAVPDVASDPHWKWVRGLDQQRYHSMLSVPIESGPRLVGVINAQTIEHRAFSEGDVEMLRAIAGQVAGIIERSELQRRLEEQLKAINLSHDIHERFTRLSVDGAGIPAILDAVAALAGGNAALYSPDGFRVRGARQSVEGMPSRVSVEGDRGEVRVKSARGSKAHGGRDIELVAVRAGSDLLGFLGVAASDVEIEEDARRRALQHGSTVLALELSKERASAEVERRLRGDLVEELLAGGLDAAEAERLARQAERLGHRLPQPAWVIVLEPDDSESEAALASRVRQDRLDAALSELARRRAAGALTLVRATSAVVVVPKDGVPDLESVERLAQLAHDTAAPVVRPGSVSVGVGNVASSVAELSRSHQEARQALRLLRRAGGRGTVTSYRSLGAFRLLLEVQSPQALGRFVDDVLGPLLRYAESRDTPLLPTLEALNDARWIRRHAARALGIHINSLSYRVERIEALMKVSLDDPEARVAIAIALRARAMLNAA